jgi:DNA modification methylase
VQFIQDRSIHLILTSPPYPLITKKAYGNRAYVDWLTQLAASWKDKLVDTGSLVINLADVFNPGSPSLSLYQERLLINLCDNLGYSLAQKFYWENPSKLPSPANRHFVSGRMAALKHANQPAPIKTKSLNTVPNLLAVLRHWMPHAPSFQYLTH